MSVLPTAVCTIESLEAEFEKLGLGSRPDEQREWASEFLKQSLRRGVVLVDDSEESNRGSDFLLVDPLRVGEEIKKFYEETQRGFKHDRRWSDGGEASSLRDRGVTTRRQCAALGYSLKDDRQAGRVRAVKTRAISEMPADDGFMAHPSQESDNVRERSCLSESATTDKSRAFPPVFPEPSDAHLDKLLADAKKRRLSRERSEAKTSPSTPGKVAPREPSEEVKEHELPEKLPNGHIADSRTSPSDEVVHAALPDTMVPVSPLQATGDAGPGGLQPSGRTTDGVLPTDPRRESGGRRPSMLSVLCDRFGASQTALGRGNGPGPPLHSSLRSKAALSDAKLQRRATRDLVEIFMGIDPGSEDLECQKTMAVYHRYTSGGRVTVEQEEWAARCWPQWLYEAKVIAVERLKSDSKALRRSKENGVSAGEEPAATTRHQPGHTPAKVSGKPLVNSEGGSNRPPLDQNGGGSSSRRTPDNSHGGPARGGSVTHISPYNVADSPHASGKNANEGIDNKEASSDGRPEQEVGNDSEQTIPKQLADSSRHETTDYGETLANSGGAGLYWNRLAEDFRSKWLAGKVDIADLMTERDHLRSEIHALNDRVSEQRHRMQEDFVRYQRDLDRKQEHFERDFDRQLALGIDRAEELRVLRQQEEDRELEERAREELRLASDQRTPNKNGVDGDSLPARGRAQANASGFTSPSPSKSSPLVIGELRVNTPEWKEQEKQRELLLKQQTGAPVKTQHQPSAGVQQSTMIAYEPHTRQHDHRHHSSHHSGKTTSVKQKATGERKQTGAPSEPDPPDQGSGGTGRDGDSGRKGAGKRGGDGDRDKSHDRSHHRGNGKPPPKKDDSDSSLPSDRGGGGDGGSSPSSDAGASSSETSDSENKGSRKEAKRRLKKRADIKLKLSYADVCKAVPVFKAPSIFRTWDQYLTKFLKLVRDNEIAECNWANIIFQKLEGDAEQTVAALEPEEQNDFQKIVNCLTKKYVKHQDREDASVLLEMRVQKKDETVEQYGNALSELARKAYPTDKVECKKVIKRRLKHGMAHFSLRSRVIDFVNKKPDCTVEDLLDDLKEHDPMRIPGGAARTEAAMQVQGTIDTPVSDNLGSAGISGSMTPASINTVGAPGQYARGGRGGNWRWRGRGRKNRGRGRGEYGGPGTPGDGQQYSAGRDTVNYGEFRPVPGSREEWESRANEWKKKYEEATRPGRGQTRPSGNFPSRPPRGRGQFERPPFRGRGGYQPRDMSKEICHKCGRQGHWARSCRDGTLMVVFTCPCVPDRTVSYEDEYYVDDYDQYDPGEETGN